MTFLLLLVMLPIYEGPSELQVKAESREGVDRVVISGLDLAGMAADIQDFQWRELFQVFLGDRVPEDRQIRPPMLGAYELVDGQLTFTPRFPFLRDRKHMVRLDTSALYKLLNATPPRGADSSPLISGFVLEGATNRIATHVSAVFPSSDRLPANLLRFYIHFSAPISRGRVLESVTLLDDRGKPVPAPFLELTQELWDSQFKRFTLFFHPGRIKRGLVPNKEEGLALQPGRSYRLVINKSLRDAFGFPLAETYEKRFVVTEPDRQSPQKKEWRVEPPATLEDPVTLSFDEPLDHALMQRMIRVTAQNGSPINGRVSVSEKEQTWRFHPRDPWQKGIYKIELNTDLEDRAGNRLNRLFDMEMSTVSEEPREEHTVLTFRVDGSTPR